MIVDDAIERARCNAPFLRQQIQRQAGLVEQLRAGGLEEALRSTGPDLAAQDMASELRRKRYALTLALTVGDLAGLLPLDTVTCHISAFADAALDAAIIAAIRERTPEAEVRGFAALALGKLGGRELNYSSDVDLIFLYDPATLPHRPREEPRQAAVRIGQRVVDLLQTRTADGFVFRVDLRLRPSPEATPIALSAAAAISYYESSALPWERAAFIRARAAAGDIELGREFLRTIHPFVWRRSLDFGAIAEVHALTRRIRDHYSGGQLFGPGYDLKRGRGGIREIEFYVQSHQLIHGGRDAALRSSGTIAALRSLTGARRIPAAIAAQLEQAYRLLRRIEHRLQMMEDRQTHSLPVDPAALDAVARLDGLPDGSALLEQLAPVVEEVARLYGDLGDEGEAQLPLDPEALSQRLRDGGFTDIAAARARVESWRAGQPRALRTAAAMAAFEAMLPIVIDALGASPDPAVALNRFDDLVRGLPSGVNFFRLLQARPGLAQLVATLLAHAPILAEQLGRRPELLDGLLDATALEPPPPLADLIEELRRSERGDEDYQLVLDRVRSRVNERRFALGAQLLLARTDPLNVATGYARVAEAALDVLAAATIAEFERAHGRVEGGELVILGLGRLGGKALTHASDLDLVYLFTGSFEARSNGAKPLGATEYFNKLAQRVSAAMSVRTAAGPLYRVDTRLRPSGGDGLLAISIDSFARYQTESAWTWEHMALTRARPVFGSAAARTSVQTIVSEVLRMARDPASVARDAARMRTDMAAAKPPAGPFDIKLVDGGLVDLEFALHVLQLSTGRGLDPRLPQALAALIDAGLVSGEVADAHRLLGRMLLTLRLVSPNSGPPPAASQPLVALACMMPDWPALLAGYAEARQRVRELWRQVRTGC